MAVEQVVAFLRALRQRLDDSEGDLLETIERDDEISAASAIRLKQALESIQQAFLEKKPS